jgi:hypothetical protein
MRGDVVTAYGKCLIWISNTYTDSSRLGKMRIVVRQSAPKDSIFAVKSLDSNVGKELPLIWNGHTISNCRIVAVEIGEEGNAAFITYDIPDCTMNFYTHSHYSIGGGE